MIIKGRALKTTITATMAAMSLTLLAGCDNAMSNEDGVVHHKNDGHDHSDDHKKHD